MSKHSFIPKAKYVNMHFVDEQYHKQHPQLIHRHKDVLELFYVMKGSGRYIVGNREYAVQPGNLVICNAGVLHGEASFQEHSMQSYCCVLTDISIPDLPSNTLMNTTYHPVLLLTVNRQPVEHLFFALHALKQQSSLHHACELLANALLEIVYRKLLHGESPNTLTNQKVEELIHNITEYLDEHFMDEISLQQLGETFHISYYYLAHIFKIETGVSPIRYVLQRRIGEAQNLLMNTEMPIGEIGELLGFRDPCHLSAAFKKYIGVTPSQYRKHFQSINTEAAETAQEKPI